MMALMLMTSMPALAGEVEILAAHFSRQAHNDWNVSVTLQHADAGWDHYADAWRVVDAKGKVLGTRTLFHPHVNEQPFTRSLGPVNIPAESPGAVVYIEAHDKLHGWADRSLKVDLSQVTDGQLKVLR